jgi:hypothetical protein
MKDKSIKTVFFGHGVMITDKKSSNKGANRISQNPNPTYRTLL